MNDHFCANVTFYQMFYYQLLCLAAMVLITEKHRNASLNPTFFLRVGGWCRRLHKGFITRIEKNVLKYFYLVICITINQKKKINSRTHKFSKCVTKSLFFIKYFLIFSSFIIWIKKIFKIYVIK